MSRGPATSRCGTCAGRPDDACRVHQGGGGRRRRGRARAGRARRRAPRCVPLDLHERDEAVDLGLLRHERGEDAAEAERLVAEPRPHPVVARGRRVALVEHEVDDLEHRRQAGGELGSAADLERHVRLGERPLGRTMRWATVGSPTRNARAISAVVGEGAVGHGGLVAPNETRAPLELGCSPSSASSTPAFVSRSTIRATLQPWLVLCTYDSTMRAPQRSTSYAPRA